MSTLLIGIIAVILLFFIAKMALGALKGFIIMAVLLILGVGIMYFTSWGPFAHKTVDIEQLKKRYCDEPEDPRCSCILLPVEQSLKAKFSAEELDAYSSDRPKAMYLLVKVFQEKEDQIQPCFDHKREGKNAEKEFYAMLAKEIGRPEFDLRLFKDWLPDDYQGIPEIDSKFETNKGLRN